MNVLLALTFNCPVCGVHLSWLPREKDKPELIEHPRFVGTEYCEYFGKVFEAPTIEFKEVKQDA